ncbi:MAG: peptidoglycan DD-metalloendopeptidase family protein [Gammaproteobacteria bacterium]|nr:peptidoglycan DD-metalloendopeptidase family protein [Gammaproteobacteria bacterium]
MLAKPLDKIKIFLLLLLILFITGCSTFYAPVENKKEGASSKKNLPLSYQVKKGDTLYSIAWKYSLNYKNIAVKNNIKSPYTIYIGQTIYFSQQQENNKKKLVTAKQSTKSTKKLSKKNKKSKSSTNVAYKGSNKLSWVWPIKGQVIQTFNLKKDKKGIDISAPKGELVKAAEAGKVVYSGEGLLGYGLLIIINHNEHFLSAYAHNQALLVHEGQIVKKGQDIAQLGRSGTNRYKLHFEIRKNGVPINPMNYLPH